MNSKLRVVVFGVGAAGMLSLMVWAFIGLPEFGHFEGAYGKMINDLALPQRHTTSAVTPVVFDYRGFDTIGEESILFAAVMGVTLVLRLLRDESDTEAQEERAERRRAELSLPLQWLCLGLVPATVVVGAALVTHGQLTPGGGFQGGVVLAGVAVLAYLAGEHVRLRRVDPVAALDVVEGVGIAGFLAIGLVGLVLGVAFLTNVMSLGVPKSVFSGGVIPIINVTVGAAVPAGLVLIIFELLEQTLIVRER